MNTSSFANLLIGCAILGILSSLASGLYYLVKDQGNSHRTVKALSFRIILSFILFTTLFIAFSQGWIAPRSLTHR